MSLKTKRKNNKKRETKATKLILKCITQYLAKDHLPTKKEVRKQVHQLVDRFVSGFYIFSSNNIDNTNEKKKKLHKRETNGVAGAQEIKDSTETSEKAYIETAYKKDWQSSSAEKIERKARKPRQAPKSRRKQSAE